MSLKPRSGASNLKKSTGEIVVRALSRRATQGWLTCGNLRFRCALGRTGRRTMKREGDGATPVGTWRLRQVLYRGDRLRRPRTRLTVRRLRPFDGWCETPGDRNYNRLVRHPYVASAETMWRADGLYDLVVVLGHNDRPRIQGRGSAIFLHVAGARLRPTEGCIAMRRDDLLRLLALSGPAMRLSVA